jgi:ferric-dicitrate binding protein FerR (iron transport regulator)
VSGVAIRVAGLPHTASRQLSSMPAASSADAKRKSQMKRFILVTALLTFIAGTFAAMVPASADPHGDRMKRDCATGARKC